MRLRRQYQHILIGLKKRKSSSYSSGMVTYVAIYIMLILLMLILGINRLADLSLSNTKDEMRLIVSHYAAESGARWFYAYCNSGNRWNFGSDFDIENKDNFHMYIKADSMSTDPKHLMSYAVSNGVTSRVHIYVKEKNDNTLEIVNVKPY